MGHQLVIQMKIVVEPVQKENAWLPAGIFPSLKALFAAQYGVFYKIHLPFLLTF